MLPRTIRPFDLLGDAPATWRLRIDQGLILRAFGTPGTAKLECKLPRITVVAELPGDTGDYICPTRRG